MSEMSRDQLLAVVRDVYAGRDPVPAGLVARMQAAAALEADRGGGLDVELMLLVDSQRATGAARDGVDGADDPADDRAVDREGELAGARGTASYTLRMVHGDTDLLLRIAPESDAASGALDEGAASARIDGWIVPPEPMTVRALPSDASGAVPAAVLSSSGRFELTGLRAGLLRLRFEPHDPARAPFLTPAFEI